jgi:hypothetical protein
MNRLSIPEARRRRTDFNTLVGNVICDALTELAETAHRSNAKRDGRGG